MSRSDRGVPALVDAPGFTDEEWEKAAGVLCPRCKRQSCWLRPADGVCKPCSIAIEKKADRDKKRDEAIAKATERYGFRIKRKKRKTPV